jgi:hypothetical protein
MTNHQFQIPHVEPLEIGHEVSNPAVLLRVAPADVKRILRALDDASLSCSHVPGGSSGGVAYRRLAKEVMAQAHAAHAV